MHACTCTYGPQVDALVAALRAHDCYGLQPDNIFVLASSRHAGYAYDPGTQLFTSVAAAHDTHHNNGPIAAAAAQHAHAPRPLPRGAGFCMAQLVWGGDAAQMGPEGALVPLQTSALDFLTALGVRSAGRLRACTCVLCVCAYVCVCVLCVCVHVHACV